MLLRSITKFAILIIFLMLLEHVYLSRNPHIRKSKATKFKGNSIVKNLPQRQVLDMYLKHLKMIVRFGLRNINLIDLNMYFGLFLVNVNLENLIKFKKRTMPAAIRMQVVEILKNNEKVLAAFKKQVEKDKNPKNNNDKMIFSLFSSVATWQERLRSYPAVLSEHMFYQAPEELTKTYNTWDRYVKKVDNVEAWLPQPELSDTCLSELARFEPKSASRNTIPKCRFTNKKCYDMLINGSDFGYALSHRLLLLILARFGRGCSVFEPAMDRELTKRFCAAAFSEAEYIAMHGFQAVDLMLEQITLCAMSGLITPKLVPWMPKILEYQIPLGCFGQSRNHTAEAITIRQLSKGIRNKMWEMSKRHYDHDIMGICNGHSTATAAAALAIAIRTLVTFDLNNLS